MFKCTVQEPSACAEAISTIHPQNSYCPAKPKLYLSNTNAPRPRRLTTTILLPVAINVTNLSTSSKGLIQNLSFLNVTFHLASYAQGSSTLWSMAEFPSLWRLKNIPFYGKTTSGLPIHPLVHTGVASVFWLLWLTLPWTRGHTGL